MTLSSHVHSDRFAVYTASDSDVFEAPVAYPVHIEPEMLFSRLARWYSSRGSPCAVLQRFKSIVNATGEAQLVMVFEPATLEIVENVGDDLVGHLRNAFARAGLAEANSPIREGFRGGLLGFISYDAHARTINTRLTFPAKDSAKTPDLVTMFVDKFLSLDISQRRLTLVRVCPARAMDLGDLSAEAAELSAYLLSEPWSAPLRILPVEIDAGSFEPMLGEAAYADAFRRTQEHLRAGDIYQLVLSQRFSRPFTHDATLMFGALSKLNSMSSYLYYLELPGRFTLFGTCGLCHVQRQGRGLSSVVFAGTRARGTTPDEDEQIANELATNVKDRAEHLMLVDLERNDLSKLSQPGSLHLREFLKISRLGTTQYLTSRIASTVREDVDDSELLVSTGPRGVVSGVPKQRALQIISDCEPERRRFYTGTVFCAQYGGDLDSAVVISSAAIVDRVLHIQCGGGITIRSEVATELSELNAKATSLFRAWALVQGTREDLPGRH